MNGLVDSQAFLWFVGNRSKLSAPARAFMADPNNDLFLSAGSLWEIAIKIGIGKLSLSEPYDVFMARELAQNDVEILPITAAHGTALVPLPFHHGDPFDRLLVAQAVVEQWPIVSGDPVLDSYSIQRIW